MIPKAKPSSEYSDVPLCLWTELLRKRSVMLRTKNLSGQNMKEMFPRTVLPVIRF